MNEIIAVICEYNPFHNGHKYQIVKIKEQYPDSCVIAIMSGNATQRGELAIMDKYLRAKAAVLCGVDCVFELPYPFSASNAELFAKAGVHIAASLGATHLCFGTESGSVEYISDIANAVASPEFEKEVVELLKDKTLSYPIAKEKALINLGKNPPKLSNDMLAVEYVRAIKKYGNELMPITVKRQGAGYNDMELSDMMSATAIREYYMNNYTFVSIPDCLKELYSEAFKKGQLTDKKEIADFLYRCVLISSYSKLSKSFDIPVGAEYYIYDTAQSSSSSKEFFDKLTTKTYTYARLRRIILYSVLGTEKIDGEPAYTTLLAANEKGRAFLKEIKKKKELPILTKLADYKKLSDTAQAQFESASKLDKLYTTFLKAPTYPADFIKKSPFII